MPEYKITLRRELSEIGISVTNMETGELVYKNGLFASVDYKNEKKFKELSSKFIEYLKGNVVIQLRNTARYYNLLNNLLGSEIIDIESVELDEEVNIVKIYGGIYNERVFGNES